MTATLQIVLKNSFFRGSQKISLKQQHQKSRLIFVAYDYQAPYNKCAGKTGRPLYSLNENPFKSLEIFHKGQKKCFSTQSATLQSFKG
jgi:hypothetical protein